MPFKKIGKAAQIVGSCTAALIGLAIIGTAVSKFLDPIVLTLAEGDDRYVQQKDYVIYEERDDIADLEDESNEVDKNIRQIEGQIRRAELEISRQNDVLWNQDEIIRLEDAVGVEEARIERFEERIEEKEDYIECIEEDREHCGNGIGEDDG